MKSIGADVRPELLPDELTLLMSIGVRQHPVGARLALRALKANGVQISEASVSRMLTKLDALGLTQPIDRKGRVLTPVGQEAFVSHRTQLRRGENFDRALELRNATELLDWLRARRVLEGEAAYLAAQRRDDDALNLIAEAVDRHEETALAGTLEAHDVGMGLHMLIARAAISPVFEALIETLTSSTANHVESTLDLVVSRRGTLENSASEHRALYEAIRLQQADLAKDIMQRHLLRLEHDVEQFALENEGGALLTALATLRSLRGNTLTHWITQSAGAR